MSVPATRCEGALYLWRRDLMGLPGDQKALQAALEHSSGCPQLSAQTLGITPLAALDTPEESSAGAIDFYEALGYQAEEQGDAYAEEWEHLAQLAADGQISIETAVRERALALALLQTAWTAYERAWQLEQTAFLGVGLARLAGNCLGELPPQKPP